MSATRTKTPIFGIPYGAGNRMSSRSELSSMSSAESSSEISIEEIHHREQGKFRFSASILLIKNLNNLKMHLDLP